MEQQPKTNKIKNIKSNAKDLKSNKVNNIKNKCDLVKSTKNTIMSSEQSNENKIIENKNIKEIIIELFNKNVKGKKFDKCANNHCGSEGHWLEKQMGIPPNSNNKPDFNGYEQKKDSAKITFGDWSASEYIFKNKQFNLTRDQFLKIFGSPNPKKNNRYSWSGKVFPKYSDKYNYAGQRIRFLENDDLVIEYSYLNDTRNEKISYPNILKTDIIILARWTKSKLEKHILNKFGVNGFYICQKNKQKIYDKICFGKVIDFQFFKTGMENNKIILDSGMYETNSRNYSQFRADKSLWYDLLTEVY